jgi:hypothetical protein
LFAKSQLVFFADPIQKIPIRKNVVTQAKILFYVDYFLGFFVSKIAKFVTYFMVKTHQLGSDLSDDAGEGRVFSSLHQKHLCFLRLDLSFFVSDYVFPGSSASQTFIFFYYFIGAFFVSDLYTPRIGLHHKNLCYFNDLI